LCEPGATRHASWQAGNQLAAVVAGPSAIQLGAFLVLCAAKQRALSGRALS